MKVQTILLMALLLAVSSQAFTQEMSKEETKYWKQLAKKHKKDPQLLKLLVEERDQFQAKAQEAESRLNRLQSGQEQASNRAAQLEREVDRLNSEMANAQETIRRLSLENDQLRGATPDTPAAPSGVVFRVQAGAFSSGAIPQQIQNLPDAMIENDGNTQKVLVGNYRTIDEARAKANQLKRSGIEGAFVVAYKNGRRITIEEALRN
ncbi:MAG: hypothetical protein J5I94_21675 [Phaeodactylibacter sp.]|nr:hypothetical protein [Phaeodactylibacter sp.]